MGFKNPILAGTQLIRDAIRTPNYVAGTTGWTINQDGSAEFTGLKINGGTIILTGTSNGIFVYLGTPGAGTLAVSMAAAAGTDAYGNAYPAGLGLMNAGQLLATAADGSKAAVVAGAAQAGLQLIPGTYGITNWTAAVVQAFKPFLINPQLRLTAPHETGTTHVGQIVLSGGLVGSDSSIANIAADAVTISSPATSVTGTLGVTGATTLAAVSTTGITLNGTALPALMAPVNTVITTSAAGQFTFASGFANLDGVILNNGDSNAAGNVLVTQVGAASGGNATMIVTQANTGAAVTGRTMRVVGWCWGH